MIPPGQLSPSWDQVMDHVQPFLVSPQGTTSRCAVEPCQAAAPWLSHGNCPYGHRVTSEPGPATGEVVKPDPKPSQQSLAMFKCSETPITPKLPPRSCTRRCWAQAEMVCAWTMPGANNYHRITEYPKLEWIHKEH